MKDCIKLTIARKIDKVTFHTEKIDLKGNQNPSDMANEIIILAKNINIIGTEVSISFLIPRGDRLLETGKKVNKELQEKCTAENFTFILHKNIAVPLQSLKLQISRLFRARSSLTFRQL